MLPRTFDAKPRQTEPLIVLALLALLASQPAAESASYSRRGRQPRTTPRPGMRSGSSSGYGETRPQRPPEKMIKVIVLDEQGNVVEDALIGSAILDNNVPTDKLPFGYLDIPQESIKTISRVGGVNSVSGSSAIFGSANPTPHADRGPVVALHKSRNLCALGEVSEKDLAGEVTLNLQPACRVFGQLTCSALTTHGLCLFEGSVDVYWKSYNPLRRQVRPDYASGLRDSFLKPAFRFEFFLPPGEYGILAKSTAIADEKRITFTVRPGQAEFNVGEIDLPPASATTLLGMQAPQIGPVDKWLNGTAIDLADSKGKNILLCFGRVPDVRDSGSNTGSQPPAAPNVGGSFSVGPNVRTGSSVSPMPRGSRSSTFFQRFMPNQRGGSRGGGAGGGSIDYKTLYIEPLITLSMLFRSELDIVALYPSGSEQQIDALLQKAKAETRGRIDVSVAADKASATRSRYAVKENLIFVLIDKQGNVAGAFDHVPCGEEFEHALKFEMPWRKDFAKYYSLKDNESIKHLPTPPLATRLDYWRSHPRAAFSPDPPGSIVFAVEAGRVVEKKTLRTGMPGDAQGFLATALGVDAVRFQLRPGRPPIQITGDWIYRPEAPYQDKAAAIEKTLSAQMRLDIVLVRHTENLATIEVFGDYKHQPLSPSDRSRAIHVFAEKFNAQSPGPTASADSIMRMLRDICREAGIDVIIQAREYKSGPVRYTVSPEIAQLANIPDWTETTRKLNLILDNLSAQTNLKFNLDLKPRDTVVIQEQQ